MRVRKYEGGEVLQIRFMHKGKDIVFQNTVDKRAVYKEDIQELIINKLEIEFDDICEMDSINEEEYKRRMERLRRTL